MEVWLTVACTYQNISPQHHTTFNITTDGLRTYDRGVVESIKRDTPLNIISISADSEDKIWSIAQSKAIIKAIISRYKTSLLNRIFIGPNKILAIRLLPTLGYHLTTYLKV